MAHVPPTLTVPSATRHLDEVRAFVERHAQEADLPPAEVEGVKLAVDEAVANVIKHAYKSEPDHELQIAVIVEEERLVVCIRDTGEPFDRTKYHVPNLPDLVKHRRRGGLGVLLMHRLMDEVVYSSEDGVNEVRLIKHRVPVSG